jgi:hypothetical protein
MLAFLAASASPCARGAEGGSSRCGISTSPSNDLASNYPAPTPRQLLYAEQARREFAHLKATLEVLTVPQQREAIWSPQR